MMNTIDKNKMMHALITYRKKIGLSKRSKSLSAFVAVQEVSSINCPKYVVLRKIIGQIIPTRLPNEFMAGHK